MAEMIPGIDEIVCLNTPWLSRFDAVGWVDLARFCVKNCKRYDLSFDLHGEPRNIILARLLARFSVGFGLRGLGFLLNRDVAWQHVYTKHIVEIQMELLKALGHRPVIASLPLVIPDSARVAVRRLLTRHGIAENRFVLVQMSSGLDNKEWILDRWKDIVERCAAVNAVVTADLDAAKVAELKAGVAGERIIDLRLDLPGYIALVEACERVVSVDTFTIHVARGLNKPLVAMYSGTNLVEEWGPLGAAVDVKVLQDRTCPYYPCCLKRCVFGHPSRCMERISVDDVASRV